MATKKSSAAPQDEVKQEDTSAPPPSNVQFVGEGAEKIKFTVDPQAKKIIVYANGLVVHSY